jgi:cytochrome c-type biogenesis protein CcmH
VSVRTIKLLLAAVLWGLSLNVMATVDLHEFSSEAERERYLVLIEEMRCPKCQNQNLAGSDSPIAQDLRREVYRMLEAGNSDDEILDFMVARYGDYVLYRPRLQSSTWLLWGLPVGLFVLGVVLVMLIGRSRKRSASGAENLNDDDRARLQALKDAAEARDQEK